MTGLKPRRFRSTKRYDFQRTFGATTVPDDFTVDKGLTMPDQNHSDEYWGNPALPNGCTGFATADIGTNDDGAVYDPRFTYNKTLLIQNGTDGDQCTLEDSFKSALVYGLRAKNESDTEALNHRRGPFFEVRPQRGQDWFDALASAAYVNNKPVSCGTPWHFLLSQTDEKGRVLYVPTSKDFVNGHDWCFSGVKVIDGVKYARVKSWQGKGRGDRGWLYFSRETINALMKVKGSDALTCAKARPEDIQTVRLNVLQVLISLYYRLIYGISH